MVMVVEDVVRCPTCGSGDIVYTCEPKCCFNHLCSDCRTTFQLLTKKSSRKSEPREVRADEPASGDPTVACAACESLKVAVLEGGDSPLLICAECRTTLELVYDEVEPDTP